MKFEPQFKAGDLVRHGITNTIHMIVERNEYTPALGSMILYEYCLYPGVRPAHALGSWAEEGELYRVDV